jgi:hypothetical protein
MVIRQRFAILKTTLKIPKRKLTRAKNQIQQLKAKSSFPNFTYLPILPPRKSHP